MTMAELGEVAGFVVLFTAVMHFFGWLTGRAAYKVVRNREVIYDRKAPLLEIGFGGSVNADMRRVRYANMLQFHQRNAGRWWIWWPLASVVAWMVFLRIPHSPDRAAVVALFSALFAIVVLGVTWWPSVMVARGIHRAGGLPPPPAPPPTGRR